MSQPSSKSNVQKTTADPEDDLDDLDDVLSQFTPGQGVQTSPPPPLSPSVTTGTSGRPRTNTRIDGIPVPVSGKMMDTANEAEEEAISSDFAKELAKGMEDLMREISAGQSDPNKNLNLPDDERARALKAAWEAMLIEGMDGALGEGSGSKDAPSDGFQAKIKQAVEKMKESESKLKDSNAPGDASLEALLQSLGDLGLGENGEDDQELTGFLENMMGQLMSKEVLYEPLKELEESFPPFLANPPRSLTEEERKQYDNQLVCLRKIIAAFDKVGYSDTNVEDNKLIVDLMSEMQSYGTPPAELMGAQGVPGVGDGNHCPIA